MRTRFKESDEARHHPAEPSAVSVEVQSIGPSHPMRRMPPHGLKPLVTVDIFRVKNGKLVEHWDVMQEDVPATKTKSGRPMFPISP